MKTFTLYSTLNIVNIFVLSDILVFGKRFELFQLNLKL
jgi:hypothetical protein